MIKMTRLFDSKDNSCCVSNSSDFAEKRRGRDRPVDREAAPATEGIGDIALEPQFPEASGDPKTVEDHSAFARLQAQVRQPRHQAERVMGPTIIHRGKELSGGRVTYSTCTGFCCRWRLRAW